MVIPYRVSMSDELIYTLRSLKNVSHGQVFIIGDKPKLSDKVINLFYKQTSDIAQNTLNIINIACTDDRVAENFYWWPDDTYLLRPLKTIPPMHRGPLSAIVDTYRQKGRFNYYTQRMNKTYNRLVAMGVETPLCYELHIPFLINKNKWNQYSKYITKELNKLTMYGNLNKIGGQRMSDVKVRRKDIPTKGYFVSTHDATFGSNETGRKIRELFPDRSVYERQ